jgi:D-alanyl-D-alanine carboxypeptidase/D-alanyl-D-alanine-endopeptidase (penicillin-binding protein 4)
MPRNLDSLRSVSLALLLCAADPSTATARGLDGLTYAMRTSSVAPVPVAKARSALAAALDRILRHRELKKVRIGMQVVDLESGDVLYAHRADELLNPASVSKVITTAVAMVRLGPEFKFTTGLYAAKRPAEGVLAGDLFVQGSGDPKLVTEQVFKLASNLAVTGVREVKGAIVVDDSYFDKERAGPGWDQDKSDRPYEAPIGAASVNFNALEVLVYPGGKAGAPARVLTDPATSYAKIENHAVTASAGSPTRIRVKSVGTKDRNVLEVRGQVALGHPGWSTWRKVDHPPYYLGTLLKEMLERLGVKVRGAVRTGLLPGGAVLLARVRSPALGVLLRDMNKVSQNFMAEQILKTVGAEALGKPGTWQKGVQAVQRFMSELGVAPGSQVFKNGSGLNDVNRVSAAQIVKLLSFMHRHFQVSSEFLASLAVAGADGSVKRRLHYKETYRRLRVKTGWLRGVSGLAGYVGTLGGKKLAFALFMNGLSSSGVGHRVQQQVARVLTAYPDVRP